MSLVSPKVIMHIPRKENAIWIKPDKGYSSMYKYMNKYT